MNGDGLPDDLLLPRNTKRSLPMALLRVREAVMCRFRPILTEHGITEQQWRVIRVVAEAGSIDATELSVRSFILAPSLTRILRSLEDRGFIERVRDRSDARRTLISMRPAGLAFIRSVAPESGVVFREIERAYGKERVEQLLDMLGELEESLRRDKP